MDLREILDFAEENKDFMGELRKTASDTITDAKAMMIEKNKRRAGMFVAALDEKIKVEGGEERLRALNAAILDLEREKQEVGDSLKEMAINHQLAQLLHMRANVEVATGFNSVVAFSDDEKEEIVKLLNQAENDIEARKNLKTAINITVRLIAISAKIAKKAATHGIA